MGRINYQLGILKKKIVTTRENKSCVDGLLNKVYNLKCVYLIWQAVNAEDLNSKCYTIDDVILPMPG
jgi:hypothetical protein